MIKNLKIREFSKYPGGRHPSDGLYSGELYRQTVLEPLFKQGIDFCIDTNGVFAIAPSFLDEAFGPFIEELGESEFRRRFVFIVNDDPDFNDELDFVISNRLNSNA